MTTTITTILLIYSVIITVLIFYISFVSIRKIESLQEKNIELFSDNTYFSLQFLQIMEVFRKIDYNGIFESNDEVGVAFKMLKESLEFTLSKPYISYEDTEEGEGENQ